MCCNKFSHGGQCSPRLSDQIQGKYKPQTKKSKKILLLTVCLFVTFSVFGQDQLKRHAVYAELGGSAFIGSVNYDFRFHPGNDGAGMRVGFGYVPDVLIFPIGLNGVLGKNRVAFEYGAGLSAAVFVNNSDLYSFSEQVAPRFGYLFYGKAGIRITPENSGFFCSLHWNPLINANETMWGWVGLGLGYSWNK